MISLLYLSPILALLLAPAVVPPGWLRGWRTRLWLACLVGGCLLYVLHLLPDLDDAGALLGAASLALALPVVAGLHVGMAAGWSWQALAGLGSVGLAILGAWAAPALAAGEVIPPVVMPPEVLDAAPWLGPLMGLVGLVTWLRARFPNGLIIQLHHTHTIAGDASRVEIHHHPAPEPEPEPPGGYRRRGTDRRDDSDPSLSEPSGARPRPPRR